MKALYRRELGYYLNNPIGYIILILFAIFANYFYIKDIFAIGSASMKTFFSILPWLFLIFIPALSMRSIAEEKRTNTIETLLSLPISETDIILAKFLSLLTLVVIGLLLTIGLPIALWLVTQGTIGRIYIPEVVIAYIGALCMGSFFIAISMFFSSLTSNQVIALLGSIMTLFVIAVFGTDFIAGVLPKHAQDVLGYFSPLYHLETFTKGLIDVRSVWYFLSGTALFLFLTIMVIKKR